MDTPSKSSPYLLIQEELRNDPWKLLIACIMLNLTNIKQARPVITEFFKKYPNPESVVNSSVEDIANIVRPLGLYNRRAASIVKLSTAFNTRWNRVTDLPGVGKYAADSYRIFVEGKIDVQPTDKKLIKYIEWARSLT